MKLNINDRAALAIKNGTKKVEIRVNKIDSTIKKFLIVQKEGNSKIPIYKLIFKSY